MSRRSTDRAWLSLSLAAVFAAAMLLTATAASARTVVLSGLPRRIEVPDTCASCAVEIALDNRLLFAGDAADLPAGGFETAIPAGRHVVTVTAGRWIGRTEFLAIPGVLSLLPPVVAILFALIFRQVVVALLVGIWLGSFLVTGFSPVASILRIADHYVIGTLARQGSDHASIVVFTLLLGGMVGITSRMGGMKGIVDRVSRIATTPRRGQLAVWLMGVLIFFDDYTNTLIVGNATRPLTDRLRISREKLSYIVDSTAAPITVLAVVTSWIGFEISLIAQSFDSLGIDRNPLATFVASIPYSFYPIFAILFVLFVILTGRDFSLMLAAERRARTTGKVSSDHALPLSNIDGLAVAPAPNVRPRFVNGILPIAVVVLASFVGLVATGRASLAGAGVVGGGFLDALKESDSFRALLWGSSAGCIVAAVLALSQRLLDLRGTIEAWMNGIKSMMTAIVILVLAWCIGQVCVELQTADYLVHHLAGVLSPGILPTIVFLLAMGISFSTGTSWGTMSILIPIVIPLVVGTTRAAGLDAAASEPVLLGSIASILSGAVFGDHCSPISDTTIMSSMASAADHVDHVRTQLPYALVVGAAALLLGCVPTALGVHPAAALAAGCGALLLVLRFAGTPVDRHPDGAY
ncbi:MAG: Na+/H+ antiporter NhaC family protein [Candidatus Krumholzibacteriota bacterium]|nr:Na+/H+ antiporter NhaC family protein [Candidatus Krumholzibacteriota bacterium]